MINLQGKRFRGTALGHLGVIGLNAIQIAKTQEIEHVLSLLHFLGELNVLGFQMKKPLTSALVTIVAQVKNFENVND